MRSGDGTGIACGSCPWTRPGSCCLAKRVGSRWRRVRPSRSGARNRSIWKQAKAPARTPSASGKQPPPRISAPLPDLGRNSRARVARGILRRPRIADGGAPRNGRRARPFPVRTRRVGPVRGARCAGVGRPGRYRHPARTARSQRRSARRSAAGRPQQPGSHRAGKGCWPGAVVSTWKRLSSCCASVSGDRAAPTTKTGRRVPRSTSAARCSHEAPPVRAAGMTMSRVHSIISSRWGAAPAVVPGVGGSSGPDDPMPTTVPERASRTGHFGLRTMVTGSIFLGRWSKTSGGTPNTAPSASCGIVFTEAASPMSSRGSSALVLKTRKAR